MYKLYFNLKSFDLDSLNRCESYIFSILNFFKLDQVKSKVHPRKCKKVTVCRSPHIDKKSREQFQIRTHKKTLVCEIPNRNFIVLFLEILKDMKFVGIELEVVLDYSTF